MEEGIFERRERYVDGRLDTQSMSTVIGPIVSDRLLVHGKETALRARRESPSYPAVGGGGWKTIDKEGSGRAVGSYLVAALGKAQRFDCASSTNEEDESSQELSFDYYGRSSLNRRESASAGERTCWIRRCEERL